MDSFSSKRYAGKSKTPSMKVVIETSSGNTLVSREANFMLQDPSRKVHFADLNLTVVNLVPIKLEHATLTFSGSGEIFSGCGEMPESYTIKVFALAEGCS